jgi:16S rRNA (guanine527-N7)-methyltransferase
MLNKYDLRRFKDGIAELGIELNDFQYGQFMMYYELLVEWNSFMNLTAITDFEEVCLKHFVDSLSLCRAIDCDKEYTVIDVGTGAGFPGIPLKIAFPNLKITLLDSLGKRVKFLNEVIDKLGLEDIDAVHGRAEDFAKPEMFREKYDLCVSRAVANLSTLSEYCLPYVKVGGYFISYKSEKISDEIKTAGKAIEILGGQADGQCEFTLPQSDIYRNLFRIKKVKATPKKYPRKAGLPSKEPL